MRFGRDVARAGCAGRGGGPVQFASAARAWVGQIASGFSGGDHGQFAEQVHIMPTS